MNTPPLLIGAALAFWGWQTGNPLVGALLLGIIQQVATVTISSAVNLLIVGLLLVGFVIVAPKGIVGLVQDFMRARASDKGQPTWRSRLAIFANMRPGAR